jgi:hypothetical protein
VFGERYGCSTVTVYPAITMVAERDPPVFAGMTNWARPLPVVLAPEMIVIHEAVVLAVHEHKGADAVTITSSVPPAGGALTINPLSWYVQSVPCITVNVWSPIVSVPFLALPGFAATVKVTEPLPLPIAPDTTVIHGRLLTADHVHPLAAATLTSGPAPPPAPMD